MLEPIPFWGMIEVDLPVKTYAGDKPNYVLTDEEIKQLAYQHRWNGDVEFARAILKKASEK